MSAVREIARRAAGFRPQAGLILGSGLNGIAQRISAVATIPYGEIPGFPVPSGASHQGNLVLGFLGNRRVACLQGRAHLYEGHAAHALALPVRTLKALGCTDLIVTNAAGSLDPRHGPGAIMAIADHINLMGANPLIGPRTIGEGPRFVPMNNAYDPRLRRLAAKVAAAGEIALHEGIYAAVAGPSFETPAEIRAYRTLGADAVGMSTVPEVIVARQAGLRVLGLSLMTNMAAGLARRAPSAAEVEETGEKATLTMGNLIKGVLAEIAALAQSRRQRSSMAPSISFQNRPTVRKPRTS